MPRCVETISVIVPTLNEESSIAPVLRSAGDAEDVERIVIDGGSDDKTESAATSAGGRVFQSARGRGLQMNEGARRATGEILLFLHGDTLLPQSFDELVRSTLRREGVVAGAFRLGIDGGGWTLRAIERVANWRSRLLQLPYGDQALFMRRQIFHQIGGFPETPILEDLTLVRRLKKHGRVALVPDMVRTSPRRWDRIGPLRTTLLNQVILLGHIFGVPPEQLARWYRRSESKKVRRSLV